MSSKHSILLGTDGPDGDSNTSSARTIMPSARVLEAAALREGGEQTELQSAACSHKESTITPSAAAASDVGFAVSAEPAASATRPKSAWAPRPIPQSAAGDDVARSTASAAPASAASSAPSGFVSSTTSTSMSSLTAAFSQVLSQQREEEEAKRVEESVRAVQNGMFAEAASAAAGGGGSTKKNLDAAATVTCFDLVTSTAARVPLAKIIAASNPAQATATIEAAAAKSTSDAKTSDTYVVIQPIDWSVHHADCTFARLTAVNQGADAVDNILLELSSERDDLTMEVAILRKQMASKDHVIEDQRGQIKQLQEQLQEEALAKAQKQQGGSSTTTSSSSSTSAAASSTSPAKARAPKIHESESEGSEEEVEEDEEEDQLDEEQGDFQ